MSGARDKTAKTADKTQTAGVAGAAKAAELAKPGDAAGSAQAAGLAKPGDAAGSAKAAGLAKLGDAAGSAQAAGAAGAAKAAGLAKPGDAAGSAKAAGAAGVAKAAGSAGSAGTAQGADPAAIAEPEAIGEKRIAGAFGRARDCFSGVGVREFIPVATLALLVIASGFLSRSFFSAANITNLLRQNAGLAIIAMGMLLVILTGGIDLSVGSMLALSAVLVAKLSLTMPTVAAICLAALFLMALGAFAAYFVSFRSLAPFVVTLALMTVARGLAFIISKGTPIRIAAGNWLIAFGNGSVLGVLPYPVAMALIVFLAVMLILRYTSYGRLVKAVGSNKSAARLSGIPVKFYLFSVYVVSGLLCSLGGVISAARAGVGSGQVGEGFELDAIAAVVIGGASLSGGKGTALNTLMGVFILGLISNIMNLMNIHSYYQQIIKGLIIVFAALLQSSRKRDAA